MFLLITHIFLISVALQAEQGKEASEQIPDSDHPGDRLLAGIQRIATISTQTFVSKVNTIKRNPTRTFPIGRKLL